jgi:glycosyltransferase involved in cell wall biosynthesis
LAKSHLGCTDVSSMASRGRLSKRLLFIVSEDYFFVSHRLYLAVAASKAGYQVAVLCNVVNHRQIIEKSGVQVFNWSLDRGSLNPLKELRSLFEIVYTIREFMPDLIHAVAIKPVIYSALASRITMLNSRVYALGGLGYVFSAQTKKAKIIKPFLLVTLRVLLSGEKTILILQNPDDLSVLLSNKIINRKHVRLIRGAGVNTKLYFPKTPSAGKHPLVILPARMLWDKGVGEFVECARRINKKGIKARFALVGDPDMHNPETISVGQLRTWNDQGLVEWWEYRKNMPNVYQQASIVCLPSYREGLPKSLLEAASCGLPIVTYDVPGCREIVIDGVNGILVPFKDKIALYMALETILADSKLAEKFGKAGREIVLENFSQEIVLTETIQVWKDVLA